MKIGDKVRVIDNPNVVDKNSSTTWKRRGQTGILDSNEVWDPGVYRVYFDRDGGYDQIYADALELIEDEQNMKKEIIGYKSPVQISDYPKGTLYIKYSGNDDLYIPNNTIKNTYSVPKEIVETWEPVYKEDQTKTLVLGTGRIKVVISKSKIDVDKGNEISFDSLKKVYDLMAGGNDRRLNIIGASTDYSVSFSKVKIGCSEFEVSEIKQIIDTYNELNK